MSDIEMESYESNFWLEDEFMDVLKARNCIGMVAESAGHVVGFMIYELHKTRLEILNFAVSLLHRREGIGSRMIARLVAKLPDQRRNELRLTCRESNLDFLAFLKSQGFRAVQVLRGHYGDDDGYVMSYRIKEAARV